MLRTLRIMRHMNRRAVAAAFMAAALMATSAAAQERPAISITPADPARWDLAGHVGWLGSNKSDIGADWDDWYNAGLSGVSGGYYFTPHVKADIQAAFATEGRIYDNQPIPVPGQPFPSYRTREHFFQTATVGASASYQFFENQWFHPSAGAGIELVRERHRVFSPQQFVPSRDPVPIVIPAETGPANVSYAVRPFVTTGFKWYVSERAFIRTGLRASFSTRGVDRVVWSTGVGVDL